MAKLKQGTGAVEAVDAEGAATKARTLRELVGRLGQAKYEEVTMALDRDDADVNDLLAKGAKVSTGRISTDALRIYEQAADFLTSSARKKVGRAITVSLDLVRIGAWAAAQGDALWREQQRQKREAAQTSEVNAQEEETTKETLRPLRDAFGETLKTVAGKDEGLRKKIEDALTLQASGSVETDVATSLGELVTVAETLLAKKDKEVVFRRRLVGLDAEYVAEVRAAANVAEGVRKEQKGTITQGEVDRWDGMNLALLVMVHDAFEGGHGRNRAVPRLPFIALRGLLKAKGKVKKKGEEEPTPEA